MYIKARRLFTILLSFQFIINAAVTSYASPVWPGDTGIQAEAGVVMDMDSGAFLFGQNIHEAYPPASITKILTALIVLDYCNPEDMVTFSDTAVYSVESDSGNKLSIVSGDSLSVEDCLYALLLVSANQAANALAEHTAGSIPAFVDMMNEKLVELGCQESHFDNPSGLNGDTQYVSAYDMALIAQAAYNNQELIKVNSAISHRIGATTNNPDGLTLYNEHRLVIAEDSTSPYYFPPAVAGKTGYLQKAGNTLVTYAESDGRRLVSVILKGQAGEPRQYFVDGKELLSFGFRSFKNINISQSESRYVTGDEIINLDRGAFKASDLKIDDSAVITLPLTADFSDASLALEALPENHPRDAVALLSYTYNQRVIGKAYLLSKIPLASPSDSSENPFDGQDAPSAATVSDYDQNNRQNPSPVGAILSIVFIILLIGAFASFIAWIISRRKKEAEALALRRERRRQRLMQEGDIEEFEKLLEERSKK